LGIPSIHGWSDGDRPGSCLERAGATFPVNKRRPADRFRGDIFTHDRDSRTSSQRSDAYEVAADARPRIVVRNHRLWKFNPRDVELGGYGRIYGRHGRQGHWWLDRGLLHGWLGHGRQREWRHRERRHRERRHRERRHRDGRNRERRHRDRRDCGWRSCRSRDRERRDRERRNCGRRDCGWRSCRWRDWEWRSCG
jgi:hypothetical protein